MPANLLPGIVAQFIHRGQTIRFFVTNFADSIQNFHANGSFYELHELAIIEKHLQAGAIYLDVGANVGNHAIFVAKYCQPAEVLVVEPNPEAIGLLRVNLLLNEVEAKHFPFGLSNVAGTAKVNWPRNNLGGARMIEDAAGAIRLVPGDALFAKHTIDFIKIDVEGLELSVLEGLSQTIAIQRPKMFIEVDNENRARFDDWCAANDYRVEETFRRYRVNENFLIVPIEPRAS